MWNKAIQCIIQPVNPSYNIYMGMCVPMTGTSFIYGISALFFTGFLFLGFCFVFSIFQYQIGQVIIKAYKSISWCCNVQYTAKHFFLVLRWRRRRFLHYWPFVMESINPRCIRLTSGFNVSIAVSEAKLVIKRPSCLWIQTPWRSCMVTVIILFKAGEIHV